MASVDGYTKAGADAAFAPIGHTHPGGGGGGISGASEVWATDLPMRTFSEGGVNGSAITWGSPYSPDGGATAGITVGTDGKLFLPEGWYTVSAWLEIDHPSASNVGYVRMAFNIGASLIGNQETYIGPSNDGTSDIFKATMSMGPLYSDGTAFVRPDIRWTNGVYTAGSVQLGIYVAKHG